MKVFLFDGSIELLYCAVFEYFETKEKESVSLQVESFFQPSFLDEITLIGFDAQKFERVKQGIEKKVSANWQRKIIYAYLSESVEVYQHIFEFLIYVFSNKNAVYNNYGNANVIAIHNVAKSVSREKHRMEAFIRFEKALDGTFFQKINPDYNVLPLISTHFKNRYADQKWIIFDEKRNYGCIYNLETVEVVYNPILEIESKTNVSTLLLDEQEMLYQQLWKDYFKATNIASRKNTKLHLQHVPRRYWKYLVEKQ